MKTFRRFSAVAAGAATIIALTACASGSAPEVSTSPTQRSASTPAGPVAAAPSEQLKTLSQKELAKALVTLDDLPPGYSKRPDGDAKGKVPCDTKIPQERTARATVSFAKGSGFSSETAAVAISQYADPADAKASMTAFMKAVDNCPTERLKGEKITWARMSAPHVGDEAKGVRLEAKTFTLLEYYTRKGRTIIGVSVGGVTSTNSALLEKLLTTQLDLYMEAASL